MAFSQAEQARRVFVDALRAFLDLEPLYSKDRERRRSELERFGARVYPERAVARVKRYPRPDDMLARKRLDW